MVAVTGSLPLPAKAAKRLTIRDASWSKGQAETDNILYDDAGRPSIADLGLACRVEDEKAMRHCAGTPKWKASEWLDRGATHRLGGDLPDEAMDVLSEAGNHTNWRIA